MSTSSCIREDDPAVAVAPALELEELRPTWRGRLHLMALLVAVPVVTLLAVLADGRRARIGVIVYAAGLCSMLAVSTTYHRWVHAPRARAIMRRADHATIFAAIAGTCTPLALLALGPRWALVVLIPTWAAAIAGASVKVAGVRRHAPIGAVLYLGISWFSLVLVPALVSRYGVLPVILLFVGGVIYTVGALGFARQWPKLKPTVFSYHEVWHAATIAAAAAHLAAVWVIAT